MKQKLGNQASTNLHLYIYVLAFLILWEWLRPIPIITNTGHIQVFVFFALFSCILIYFKTPIYAMLPSMFIGSILGLNYIFNSQKLLDFQGFMETVQRFFTEAIYNIHLIVSWNLASLTDFFRTFLLFLLLSLICYLLYFWIFHTKKIFFFLLSTVIYITVLDTFTEVDASNAIIRIVVIGFFIMTLLHMLKIQEEVKEIGQKRIIPISITWMYTLIIMIVVALFIGIAAPKQEPRWADPVPTFRSLVLGENGIGDGTRRVGYGDNDEILGGGFVQDYSTVFFAETTYAGYWRGESKDEYTGRGWIAETSEVQSETVFEQGEIDYWLFGQFSETVEHYVRITLAEDQSFDHLFYPGQLTGVNVDSLRVHVNGQLSDASDVDFFTDITSGKVSAKTNNVNDEVSLTSYSLSFEPAKFPIDALQNSEASDIDVDERYLQLPDTLPERVYDLAEEIVADHDNLFDKVVAVEQYFSENDFEYETTNVPIPEEGQDYVDQFLFETQYGYCDNFSTAMAVLLRTLDIPTRWVKGFTQGEVVDYIGESTQRYEVLNSNAHSWVEVYFPGVGWVPFEPTQGFNNNVDFYEESEEASSNIEEEEFPEEEELDEQDQEIPSPEEDDLLEDEDENDTTTINNDRLFANPFTMKNILISMFVLLFVVYFYRKQNILQNKYFMMKYRISGKDEKYSDAYERLLWILANEGLPRQSGETLREYAKRVDRFIDCKAMTDLTNTYEKIYYGGKVAEGDWEKLHKEWERVVKTITS
ncbi:DUF4129 domain-containing transglutaminase family protein [Evansella cellulosilytica]|uniref:Transglutaminase domain-containing protein n=1 Tax=Evansella cellulosilytica (strain ATCC 21833 / DSM 2522 / FERM P-1141 / JCM 9156 / N-4) TaxID=649639 RepID=E6TVX5_EVAC2|nr:transglutaminase domain-containing protein [Evansella cellulosilytica]ADU28684.1 transglutaminase domain-containing protein [Evansella cellulosilytica DSM 2522]